MRTAGNHGTFDDAIAAAAPEVQALAGALRDLVAEVYPDAVEVAWPSQHVVGYGVGPKKMSEHFCYISALQDHADLGFNYGAVIPDPAGLLEGTGDKFRHVKIRSSADVERPVLKELLKSAVEERRRALGLSS